MALRPSRSSRTLPRSRNRESHGRRRKRARARSLRLRSEDLLDLDLLPGGGQRIRSVGAWLPSQWGTCQGWESRRPVIGVGWVHSQKWEAGEAGLGKGHPIAVLGTQGRESSVRIDANRNSSGTDCLGFPEACWCCAQFLAVRHTECITIPRRTTIGLSSLGPPSYLIAHLHAYQRKPVA